MGLDCVSPILIRMFIYRRYYTGTPLLPPTISTHPFLEAPSTRLRSCSMDSSSSRRSSRALCSQGMHSIYLGCRVSNSAYVTVTAPTRERFALLLPERCVFSRTSSSLVTTAALASGNPSAVSNVSLPTWLSLTRTFQPTTTNLPTDSSSSSRLSPWSARTPRT